MPSSYSINIQRLGGVKCYSPIIIGLYGTGFNWTDRDETDTHGGGDNMNYIVIGKIVD